MADEEVAEVLASKKADSAEMSKLAAFVPPFFASHIKQLIKLTAQVDFIWMGRIGQNSFGFIKALGSLLTETGLYTCLLSCYLKLTIFSSMFRDFPCTLLYFRRVAGIAAIRV
jgi:hypothetical protein